MAVFVLISRPEISAPIPTEVPLLKLAPNGKYSLTFKRKFFYWSANI